MLDLFRKHNRIAQFLLLLVILPGLGFVGIAGFRGLFDDSANVASVDGQKIPRQVYDAAVRDQLDRMRQILRDAFDAKTFDTPALRRNVLDGLINQRVVADQARKLHLTASDDAVRRALLDIPAIAALRKPDGSIDADQYQALLATQGLTADRLDAQMRATLADQQLTDAIRASSFTPKALAEQLTALSNQQREVRSLTFRTADYAAKVHPTDAQLQQYYDSHAQSFATQESATIEYVTLSATTLAASIQPTDDDLKTFYEDNIKRFRTEEQVRASHILIAVPAGASDAQRRQAKAKADAILAQVRRHPDQFAALAKKSSDDKGSADKGGDLGYFSRGMMVKPFEDAAFKLKAGQISDVVQSDFGYHIIRVTDVKPAVTRPFSEVKSSLVAEVASQLAAKRFADDADAFGNMVYEQADSLKPAADKYKLKIQTATVTRKPNPAFGAGSPLNNPKFLAAVFADDAIKAKHNTAAIDVGGNTLVSAHVVQYKPSTVPPFDAVKADVRQRVVAQQAAALAVKEGSAKLRALGKSGDTTGFGPRRKINRVDTGGAPPTAIAAIFKADASRLPAYTGVDLGADGYAIYRIDAVDVPPSPTPQQLAGAQRDLAGLAAQSEIAAYLQNLRSRARVKIYGTP